MTSIKDLWQSLTSWARSTANTVVEANVSPVIETVQTGVKKVEDTVKSVVHAQTEPKEPVAKDPAAPPVVIKPKKRGRKKKK